MTLKLLVFVKLSISYLRSPAAPDPTVWDDEKPPPPAASYPTGVDDVMMSELTMEELKAAFRSVFS